jgi:hypothetical protein
MWHVGSRPVLGAARCRGRPRERAAAHLAPGETAGTDGCHVLGNDPDGGSKLRRPYTNPKVPKGAALRAPARDPPARRGARAGAPGAAASGSGPARERGSKSGAGQPGSRERQEQKLEES